MHAALNTWHHINSQSLGPDKSQTPITSTNQGSTHLASTDRTSADRTQPAPERAVGRASPPYCRLQSLPWHTRPDTIQPNAALPVLNLTEPATSALQREQQREPKPPVLPSAAVAITRRGLPSHILPCRAELRPSLSGFQRTQRRGPKPSALRSISG